MNFTIQFRARFCANVSVHHTFRNNGKSRRERYILIQRFPSGTSRHSDGLVPDGYVNEKRTSHFNFIDLYVVDGSSF